MARSMIRPSDLPDRLRYPDQSRAAAAPDGGRTNQSVARLQERAAFIFVLKVDIHATYCAYFELRLNAIIYHCVSA